MRILITGGTGLLGAHLVCYLVKKGYLVTAIRRADSDLRAFQNIASAHSLTGKVIQDRVEWRIADLLDITALDDAMVDVDRVVHTAAIVSFRRKDRQKMLAINQEGTANVVNACLKADVQKLVHVSSTSVFPASDRVVDESMNFDPNGEHSYYGLTKHLAELEVFRGQEEGLEVAVINPCLILGYGNWNTGSSKLFRQASRSFPFYSSGANAFVGVADVCAMIEKLLAPGITGQYLCVSENLSFRAVQNMMADAFSARRPRFKVGERLTGLAWKVAAVFRMFGLETMITRESARAANRVQRYDAGKAKRQLDQEFTPVREVIEDAARLYLEKTPEKG